MVRKIFRGLLRMYLRLRRCLSHEKFVFFETTWCGLGNRIKGLANTYVGIGNQNIYLRWGLDEWVPEPFENLFKMTDAPGFKVLSSKVTDWYPLWFYPYPQKQKSNDSSFWRLYVPPQFSSLGWSNVVCRQDGYWYGKKEGNMLIDWHYNDIPFEIREVYAHFFRQLRPSENVEKRVCDAMALISENKLELIDLVMVQVRNCSNVGDVLRVCSVGSIIEEMRKYSEAQWFYLSCLEKDVSDRIRADFPGRIIELPNKNYRSMVDAVADMWILGRGRMLVCSPRSTFNEVAWWWGGAKCPVKMLSEDVGESGQIHNVF